MTFTKHDIETTLGELPGVQSVQVDTLKPGVARVRVVGASVEAVVLIVRMIRPIGASVVVEHQASIDSAITETFIQPIQEL